jgi:NTP pyrophosphatase (non-canonical NTP hydrolase)
MKTQTLVQLREQGAARSKEWAARNAAGAPDQDPWAPEDWFVALLGEIGEAANVAKKMRRGFGNKEAEAALRPMLARELADSVIYLEHLAREMGVGLSPDAYGIAGCPTDSVAHGFRYLTGALGDLGLICRDDIEPQPDRTFFRCAAILAWLQRIAEHAEIDLDAAVIHAFNAKSIELGVPQRITGAAS